MLYFTRVFVGRYEEAILSSEERGPTNEIMTNGPPLNAEPLAGEGATLRLHISIESIHYHLKLERPPPTPLPRYRLIY